MTSHHSSCSAVCVARACHCSLCGLLRAVLLTMAAPVEAWRSMEKRREVVAKLEEAIKSCTQGAPVRNPVEVERHLFDKAKNQEEYTSNLHKVIFTLSRHRDPTHLAVQPSPSMAASVPPAPPHPSQMGPGMGAVGRPHPSHPAQAYTGFQQGPVMQHHPGMPVQHASQLPQYNRALQGGMRSIGPAHIGPAHNLLGGQTPGYQPPQAPIMMAGHPPYHQPAHMGGGYGMVAPASGAGLPPRYGVPVARQPGMMALQPGSEAMMGARQPMAPGHPGSSMSYMPTMTQPRPPVAMAHAGIGRGMFPPTSLVDSGSVQSVTTVPNPAVAQNGVRPAFPGTTPKAAAQPAPVNSVPQPQKPSAAAPVSQAPTSTPSSPAPAPPTSSSSSSSANPPTPLSSNQPVPSPGPPPTPILPFSPMPASPAQQPTLTPEENTQYLHIFSELQKYVPLLSKMLSRLSKQLGDDHRSGQHTKMKRLYDVLQDSTRRVPLPTLIKCREVLENMFRQQRGKEQDTATPSTPSLSASLSSAPIPSPSIPPHPPLPDPALSQSLLGFKMVHSPPPTCQNLMETVHPKPLPAERLPPAKRLCNRVEPKYPPCLLRELACLEHFKIALAQAKDCTDKAIVLECSIVEEGLPAVPPLSVQVPRDYPHGSVQCHLAPYEGGSPLHAAIGRGLAEHLAGRHRTHTLSSVLASWEHCIVMAMAKELSPQEE